jgi:transposase
MRGRVSGQLSLVATPVEELIPAKHPIRKIKEMVDRALGELSPVFDAMYSENGKPSLPPEQLLKASLLIALYSIRSERQFCERLQYDLLFKWFLDMNAGDLAFDHSTFSRNRERLLEQEVSHRFFHAVLEQAKGKRLMSKEHFTVDGTLLEAWASLKSLRPKDEDDEGTGAGGGRNVEVDFHGEKRSNATHQSTTDPQAKLARKSNSVAARLSYQGNVLMENRSGLVADVLLCEARGDAEREAALHMLERTVAGGSGVTLGADKGYDTRDFIAQCREHGVTPHVSQNVTKRRSAIDGRTTRHRGYRISQRLRKRVEEIYGWVKTVGGGRKLRYRGVARNQHWMEMTATAYNLVRMAKLMLLAA